MTHQLTKEELRNEKPTREEFLKIKRNNMYLLLDSIKVAHNIGTIFRLADSLLFKKIYLCGNTILPPNYKIRVASRGSDKWVPFEYHENILDVIKLLKNEGVDIVSVEVASNSVNYATYNPTKPVAIVLGREFDGVSKEVLELSDAVVHLPLLGMANSLNVATAGAVVMYDIYNKMKNQNLLN